MTTCVNVKNSRLDEISRCRKTNPTRLYCYDGSRAFGHRAEGRRIVVTRKREEAAVGSHCLIC